MPIAYDLSSAADTFAEHGVGFEVRYDISMRHDYRYVGLVKLYVPDEFRRKGFGDSFMEEFVAILDDHGFGAKVMASEKYNIPLESLIHFYGKFGFVPVAPESIGDGFRQRLLEREPR